MSDPSWDRDLEHLREKYRGKLREQIATLGEGLRGARESESERAQLETARQLVHRLKGTSGSYGFQESCAALERIEAQLDALLETAPPDLASIWADIEQLLEHARRGL
jgi:HPt (histidine-containing phosphotransfer) domain-containing protein